MTEMVEKVARAICANSAGGFCRDVGGDLGCKNGRGVSPHWTNCVASADQLGLCGHATAAGAAVSVVQDRIKEIYAPLCDDYDGDAIAWQIIAGEIEAALSSVHII